MKRYDMKAKSLLRKAGMAIAKWNHNHIVEDGIEVTQESGVLVIDARELYTQSEVMAVIGDLDVEVFFQGGKAESTQPVTKEEMETVMDAIMMIGNGKPVTASGIIEMTKLDELRVLTIITELACQGYATTSMDDGLIVSLTKKAFRYIESFMIESDDQATFEDDLQSVVKTIDKIDNRLQVINEQTSDVRLRLIYSREYDAYVIVDLYTGEVVKSLRSVSLKLHQVLTEAWDIINSELR